MSKHRRTFYTAAATALLLIVGVGVFSFWHVRTQLAQELKEQAALRGQIAQAELDKSYFEKLIEFSGTDEYIKRLAKEMFGMVEPGEIQYAVVSPTPAGSPAP